jgi:hypothetical protein
MPIKTMYWVRSKQTNEIGVFGRHPVPARFDNLEAAKDYRRQLNLRRGAFHPGYFIDEENSAPVLMRGIDAHGYSVSKGVAGVVRLPAK